MGGEGWAVSTEAGTGRGGWWWWVAFTTSSCFTHTDKRSYRHHPSEGGCYIQSANWFLHSTVGERTPATFLVLQVRFAHLETLEEFPVMLSVAGTHPAFQNFPAALETGTLVLIGPGALGAVDDYACQSKPSAGKLDTQTYPSFKRRPNICTLVTSPWPVFVWYRKESELNETHLGRSGRGGGCLEEAKGRIWNSIKTWNKQTAWGRWA